MSNSSGFIGGGGSHVQQLIAGTGIALSPSSGFGVVTINSAEGSNILIVDGGTCSTYRCGVTNCSLGSYSFAGGGQCNAANGNHSFIGGGLCNCATACSAVLGGFGNNVSGIYSGAVGCNLNACNAYTFYSNNLCSCGISDAATCVTSPLICGTTSICTPIVRTTNACVTSLTSGQAVCSGANGILTNFNIPTTAAYGLYAQTTDSAAVTATNIETTIIGAGVGTLSVPANGFSIGDSFLCALDGLITCLSSSTIIIRVKTVGGVLLADSGIIDLTAATNKSWILNLYFTIRTLGGAGAASISSGGLFSYIRNGGTQFEGYVLTTLNTTTFNTTIDNTLVITVQWDTNSASNSIFSRNFTLTKVY